MKIKTAYILILFLALPAAALAQMEDCRSAVSACNSTCEGLSILTCVPACTAGYDSCTVQDSKNGCDTFYYHCINACPNDENFKVCHDACTDGILDCALDGGDALPRERSTAFNACEEGRYACYAACWAKGAGKDFEDGCIEACNRGEDSCKANSLSCDHFFESCRSACPACQEICESARFHCRKIKG